MTYDEAVIRFVKELEKKVGEYNKRNGYLSTATFAVQKRRKFDKVIRHDSGTSVYCYIDRATGGLLKGNWKSVEDHRERGNIFNNDPLQGCDPYGLVYIVGPKFGWGA